MFKYPLSRYSLVILTKFLLNSIGLKEGTFWKTERKRDIERSIHIAGKRTIIKTIKNFMEKSRTVKIVYDKPPEWLITH